MHRKSGFSVCSGRDSRPLLTGEHRFHAPARAEYVERLGEAVVVNQPGVDGKQPHHQDDVASAEERRPYLRQPAVSSIGLTITSPAGSRRSYLVTGPFLLLLLFSQHHPQGEEAHDNPVAKVAEHHGKQEGEGDDGIGGCRQEEGKNSAENGQKRVFGFVFFGRVRVGSSYLGLPRGSPPPRTPPRCSEIQT